MCYCDNDSVQTQHTTMTKPQYPAVHSCGGYNFVLADANLNKYAVFVHYEYSKTWFQGALQLGDNYLISGRDVIKY